ncbi:MAG TPA: diacylglycerol kinase family protein [Candidatus Portnoybacteria bacterium]|nr:MAG: putative lipid kinase [Parcubacteria group bacterium ADurb.Bin115]HNU97021.1 diacylglycerol kinase family protein [Candidatus Portnoybacteria bacterium]
MNTYIYDDFLNKGRYRRALNKVEIRLTDLGLNGKIIRLGSIKNVKEVIQTEIKNGVKTIVAVGNNATANKVISAMITNKAYDFFQKDVLFSIIPIGDNNSIATSFGIKKEEEACNILLARRIKQIDIGIAGNNIFLNKVEILSEQAEVKINEDYILEINKKTPAKIINLNDDTKLSLGKRIDPYDNKLNLIIEKKINDTTFITGDDFKISGQGKLLLDESIEVLLPAEVGLIKEKINIIVGKDRSFI